MNENNEVDTTIDALHDCDQSNGYVDQQGCLRFQCPEYTFFHKLSDQYLATIQPGKVPEKLGLHLAACSTCFYGRMLREAKCNEAISESRNSSEL